MVSKPPAPTSSLTKPSLETFFHIDYEWWQRAGQDLRLYMIGHLCEQHREQFAVPSKDADSVVDWVDPWTGQVSQANPMTYVLLSHCSRQPDYITERTSLVDAVFRTLLAAGNRPMTPVELAERTERSANTILRTLSGRTIYKGLCPISKD
ncbi:MAG: hypothetical protein JXB07_10255 [Anaerolineae bacterium]|nr:hypothetical protein [Anaerolineae bacterium]